MTSTLRKKKIWLIHYTLKISINVFLQEKADLHNEKLRLEVENLLETEILKQLNDLEVDLDEENLDSSLGILVENAFDEVCWCSYDFNLTL